MYYTEEEPPMEFIGKKRHYFGRPSIKGIASVNPAGVKDPSEVGFGMQNGSNAGFSQNPSGQVIMKNPESSEAFRNLTGSQKDLRSQFEIAFRQLDVHGQGIIRKDEFVNSLFEISKDVLSPAQILSIV